MGRWDISDRERMRIFHTWHTIQFFCVKCEINPPQILLHGSQRVHRFYKLDIYKSVVLQIFGHLVTIDYSQFA